jgi:MoaA/NifB/PqqE/SkfB family radical SAM enzyme
MAARPVACYFYVCYECMARCPFCTIWRMQAEALPRARRLALLREIRDAGVRYVDFTGGEPLLCEHLPDLLAEARRLGLITTITTNCYLYPQRHEELRGLVDVLGFSIHGATREAHDAACGLACYDRMVESIARARSSGDMLHLHATATAANAAELPAIAAFAQAQGVPLAVFPVFSYDGNVGLPGAHLRHLAQLGRRRGVFVNRASLRLARRGGNHVRRPVCRGPGAALAITPDGALAMPCFHRRQALLPTGGGLAEALASAEAQRQIALAGRQPCCEGCQNWCYLNPSLLQNRGLLYPLLALSSVERLAAMARASGRSSLREFRRLARMRRQGAA